MNTQETFEESEKEFVELNVNTKLWGNNDYNKGEENVYSYDEAIDLTGNGWYMFSLLGFLLIAYCGMSLDTIGFAVVVSAACDLELTHYQKTILLSMPFLGAIAMAYPWGYIADTRGRHKSLIVSLFGSFIFAIASAFAPNWIVLAGCKFGGVLLCSGIQPLGITLLGESCSQRLKGPFSIAVATPFLFLFTFYSVLGYFILKLQFAFDLGFIVFSPWRLLALVMALPHGVSLVLSTFFYESPKFLINAGNEKQALDILQKICKRNGGDTKKYPVKRIMNEKVCLKLDNVSFLQSLKDQTFPLFKSPLLGRTLKLFYITTVIYAQNNGFFSWIPFVIDSFCINYDANSTSDNMCGMIEDSNKLDNNQDVCIKVVKDTTVYISIIQGIFATLLIIVTVVFSNRKKIIMMAIFAIISCCGVLLPLVSGRLLVIALLYGFLTSTLCISIVFSFYVDLFPTSYRGMAACLGAMVARISGLIGTYLVGRYLSSHCTNSFLAWAAYSLSGAIVTWFLPSNIPKKHMHNFNDFLESNNETLFQESRLRR